MPIRTPDLTPAQVARTFRSFPPQPEIPDDRGWHRLDQADLAAETAALLASRPPGPLYVFAYGSLLWKPVFAPARTVKGTALGWHREFCILMTSFRGTPDAPGLMLALMPGGDCTGLAFAIEESEVEQVTSALIARETPYRELAPNRRWLQLETDAGQITALTFYADPQNEELRLGQSAEATACMIASACGPFGSNADYLLQTVTALEANGIEDAHLWELQRLVSEEIDRRPVDRAAE